MANNTIKTYKDYTSLVKLKFPDISEKDIDIIVLYGFRLMYMGVISGCDISVISRDFKLWFYIGSLTFNSIKHFNYYLMKLFNKIRYLFNKTKPEYQGYYYTYLTMDLYLEMIKPKRGKKKSNYVFLHKYAFLLIDACRLKYSGPGCIIRYKFPVNMGFEFYREKLECKNPEIVEVRESALKFEDVLISNHEYEII